MILALPIPFCGVDPAIGRVDYASLPQQALMEMLIAGLENIDEICGSGDAPDDVADWHGVKVDAESSEVIGISWEDLATGGSLDLQWLPSTVCYFDVSENDIVGSINLSLLPPSVENARMFSNDFTGPIDWAVLHDGLVQLDVSDNKLTGSIELEHLPKSMKELILSWNAFTGSISLLQLPGKFEILDIRTNQLSANPTKGHLSVVGWTSTPVLGEAKNLFKPLVVFLSWRRPY
ncbi:hypothetical protein XU18_4801 [Perkinsela sp. CCAP 1560/4]|nr:hypothetical protein XU18_4801 [Perkinsela sp. CCAP 1560/4]|eukprot:KNH03847.1 hypothetical protein XU18_4801 [Perkinsela sp. CCAP 1560/4]